MDKNHKNFVLIGFCIILILMFTGAVSAANWTVNPGNSIQLVINNASSNDTILVNNNNGNAYTYQENIVVNKKLNITAVSGGNVTISALNPSLPVITINNDGSGSTIQNFIITGSSGYENSGIYIDCSSNNIISGNIITNNSDSGIFINYGSNNNISSNKITNNGLTGAKIWNGINNTVYGNIISNNYMGLYIYNTVYDSPAANIYFNKITQNSLGLYIEDGMVNAQNNWWGTNNPVESWNSSTDIYLDWGIVNYNPWLVLKINATPNNISNENSTITIDITHNSQDADTSSQGHIPDNIPINFVTNLGIVTSTSYTNNGKSNATFNRRTSSSGIASIIATLDNQTVQTNITIQGIDTTAPIVTANTVGGVYNTTQVVTLNATDNNDPNPIIYYTTDGCDPTTLSTSYAGPINILRDTTLKFMAVDNNGNQAQIQTITYTIKLIMNINTRKTYSLIQEAINDPLTLNGHIIEVQSGAYAENIVVNKPITLRPVSGGNVTINALDIYKPIITINPTASGTVINGFKLNGSLNSAIIYLNSTKKCNITENTLMGNNETDGILLFISNYSSCFDNNIYGNHINNCINGIYLNLSGLTRGNETNGNNLCLNNIFGCINGIYVNLSGNVIDGDHFINNNTISNCTNGIYFNIKSDLTNSNVWRCTYVYGNTIFNNNNGIYLNENRNLYSYSSIHRNNIYSNINGIYSYNSSAYISDNTIVNNDKGINLYNSEGHISSNVILENNKGIFLYNSVPIITLNRIAGNNEYGLEYQGNSTVSAPNNWWGSNNPIQSSSTVISDICIRNGSVNFDPWIIFNLTASPSIIQTGDTSTIIAGLYKNNRGEDINYILPDGPYVTFNTTIGAINNSLLIGNKGNKAITNLTNTSTGIATITATLDNQQVFTQIKIADFILDLTVNGTALNPDKWYISPVCDDDGCPYYVNFNEKLNLSQRIPIDDTVTWVTVIYKSAIHSNERSEVDILLNGELISKYDFFNDNMWFPENIQSLYHPTNINYDLGYIRLLNFVAGNTTEESAIWQQIYNDQNLTANDINFIQNYRSNFTDQIQLSLSSAGGIINKTETMTYFNGPAAGFECIQSFAIVTGKITNDIMSYWLAKKTLYDIGPQRAAYGTFMTALTTIWLHDKRAEDVAPSLNVTWFRTSPTIVMDGVSRNMTYIHCPNPTMGMDIQGNTENVKLFRFLNSLLLSSAESSALSLTGYNVTSSISEILSGISEGKIIHLSFDENNIGIFTLEGEEQYKLIIDFENWIVKDVVNYNGFEYKGAVTEVAAYCFHFELTDRIENNIPPILTPEFLPFWVPFAVGSLPLFLPQDSAPTPSELVDALKPALYINLNGYNPPQWPNFNNRYNPLSEKDLENYIREKNVQNMLLSEEQCTEAVVNAIGGIPGSDPYDDAGQVIDALSRDAGKRLYNGYKKMEEGNTASGMLDFAIALGEIQWAILLKIAYP